MPEIVTTEDVLGGIGDRWSFLSYFFGYPLVDGERVASESTPWTRDPRVVSPT